MWMEIDEPKGPFLNPSAGTWCVVWRKTPDNEEYRCKNKPEPEISVLGFGCCSECYGEMSNDET